MVPGNGPRIDLTGPAGLSMMHARVQTVHMVGIGGSGMSGIAEVLLNMGFTVTGSDLSASAAVRRLTKLGARIFIGHQAGNVGDADVVVKSTAINGGNPELERARERKIPIIPRAEMLAELMRLQAGIAVAGTHGKTTTTSILATIFGEAGQDPTVIIGGRLNAYGAGAHLGMGNYLIAEADESDGSFLCLSPIINVVTNVDRDHLDFYADQKAIDAAFSDFLNKIPFYGMNVICGDDPGVQRLLPHIRRPFTTYGLNPGNRLRGEILTTGLCSLFRISLDGEPWAEATLTHPGRHNVLNALAAISVSIEAGLPQEAILRGLSNFGGVGRRFERKGERSGVLVVDDYGHHPAEIKQTLNTARACFPNRRLVVAFQPHRFSRTQALFGDFCTCFGPVDKLLLTEIYPASEAPIPGVSGASLAQGIRQVSQTDVSFAQNFDELSMLLEQELRPGDLLLTLGAGSIWRVGERWLKAHATNADGEGGETWV